MGQVQLTSKGQSRRASVTGLSEAHEGVCRTKESRQGDVESGISAEGALRGEPVRVSGVWAAGSRECY